MNKPELKKRKNTQQIIDVLMRQADSAHRLSEAFRQQVEALQEQNSALQRQISGLQLQVNAMRQGADAVLNEKSALWLEVQILRQRLTPTDLAIDTGVDKHFSPVDVINKSGD